MKLISQRLSPGLVVALIALFVALGGGAYAASTLPANSVGTKQLKKSAVTSKKLHKNAVTTAKIKDHAVTAAKINPSGLTVPNALHADSADSATHATSATTATNATHATSATSATSATTATNATHATSAANLDHLTRLNWRVPASTAAQTIYTSPDGKLVVQAACDAGNNITLTLTTNVDHAVLDSYGTLADIQQGDFVHATPAVFTNNLEERTIVYTEPDGAVVTLIYAVNNGPNLTGVNCLIDGTALAN